MLKRATLIIAAVVAAQAATVHEANTILFDAARRGDVGAARAAVESGAEVNARNPLGQTPLILAAARPGGDPVVKFLLDSGADPNIADKTPSLTPSGYFAGGNTALIEAARIRDGKSLRLLLAGKADPNGRNAHGATALVYAALAGNTENARTLLAAKADVNARVDDGTTPLMVALQRDSMDLVSLLLDNGADAVTPDKAGNTPLMWAAYSETGSAAMLERLVKAGAKVDGRNAKGESAIDWARPRGETEAMAFLTREAARQLSTQTIREAAQKAIPLLQTSSIQFFKVSGCASCHNQSLPAMALKRARANGLEVNEELGVQQRKMVAGFLKPMGGLMTATAHSVPDAPATLSYLLMGLMADDPQNDQVPVIVQTISSMQRTDGSFPGMAPRPPMTNSDTNATALAVIALQETGMADAARIAAAVNWLRTDKPYAMTDQALRVWALAVGKAPQAEVNRAAKALLAEQRADGGWASLAKVESDAFATGLALEALRQAGALKATSESYRRGLAYLVSTQKPDGTWHVATRSFPIQPYKESGFPYGKDQWISAAATSYALLALSEASAVH